MAAESLKTLGSWRGGPSGSSGCTYADACLKAGISKSTFQLWKKKGQEQKKGQFSDFSDELEEAEADFRAHHLKKIQESSVETRKTVRTIGDGDDQKTFQEVVEITRPPTWTASAWLLERKYSEQYSRKHLEVNARVTNTEPPPLCSS